MSIYHLHAQIIGRTAGRSACAAAAYRSASRIEDRTTGEVFDYTRKERPLASGILGPENSPPWEKDRGNLWNAVEEKENRKNSQFAREFDIAIPHEVGDRDKARIVREFCKENFASRGLVADYAIHKPGRYGDERNYHAHIMVTTRRVDANQPDGWGEKDREANSKEYLRQVRESWATIANKELERIGSKELIDGRMLEEQGIDRDPQRHQGATAAAMERKGKNPDRTRFAEADPDRERRKELSRELQETEAKIEQTERAYSSALQERAEREALRERERQARERGPQITARPEDWKSYEAQYRESEKHFERRAFAQAVQMNRAELLKVYDRQSAEVARKQTELNRGEPRVEPRRRLDLFREYKANDGKRYGNYADYVKAQEKLLRDHERQTQENIKQQKEISDRRTVLERAGTPEELAKAGSQFDREVQRRLREVGNQVLDRDPKFKEFRTRREEFRTAQREQEHAAKVERKQQRGRGDDFEM